MDKDRLQGNNSFNGCDFLIDADNGLAGGHHHLERKADVVAVFGFLFGRSVKGKQISYFLFFAFRYDEFEHVQCWPRVMLVKLFAEGFNPDRIHKTKSTVSPSPCLSEAGGSTSIF